MTPDRVWFDEVTDVQDEISKIYSDRIDAMMFNGRMWIVGALDLGFEESEFKQWLDKFKETHASL